MCCPENFVQKTKSCRFVAQKELNSLQLLNGGMNVELDVNFEGTEVGISGPAIDGVEFAVVVLVHQTG